MAVRRLFPWGAALFLALASLLPATFPPGEGVPPLLLSDGKSLKVLTPKGAFLTLASRPEGALSAAFSSQKGWAILRLDDTGEGETLQVEGKTFPLPRLLPKGLPPEPPGPRLLWDPPGTALLVLPREGKPLLYREGALSPLSFAPPAQTVMEAAFSPEGRFLALRAEGEGGLRVAVLDVLGGGSLLAQAYGGKGERGLAFAEGSLFFAASPPPPREGNVEILELDLRRKRWLRRLSPPPGWSVDALIGDAGGRRLLFLLRPQPPLVEEAEAPALWSLHLGTSHWERWTYFRSPYAFGPLTVWPSPSRRPIAAWLSPAGSGVNLWLMGESPPHLLWRGPHLEHLRFIPALPSRGEPAPGSMGLWCRPTWTKC